jgi:hypothetical protein
MSLTPARTPGTRGRRAASRSRSPPARSPSRASRGRLSGTAARGGRAPGRRGWRPMRATASTWPTTRWGRA